MWKISHSTTNKWCLDSGVTLHMCKDRTAFEILDEQQKDKVCTAIEKSKNSLGRGEVKINANLRNKKVSDIRLKNVMWVPEFRNNVNI